MTVRMGLLNKRDDWTIEQFREHWIARHGPLAARIPGLTAYHQNHVVDQQQRGITYKRGPEQVDGISELWFYDIGAMEQGIVSPIGPELIEDESRFIGRLRIVTVEPVEVIPPPLTGVGLKRMSFLRRRADVSPERFEHEWRRVHGPLVRRLPGVKGYRQNLVTHRESPKGTAVGYSELPIDGIVELWFDTAETLDAAFASPAGVETMAHATTFIDEITTFLVDPVVIR